MPTRTRTSAESPAAAAAIRAGDESAFVALAERYRRQLHVHCYRMVGSLEDAEDLVQESILRAWRRRTSFEGRSSFRGWLYRIATNACLDFLERRPSRVLAPDVVPASDPLLELPAPAELPWLDPYPDRLLEPAASRHEEPEAVVVGKETIELAFMAAIQHLQPRRRAVLVLRDVLGWSAKDTAAVLGVSVASANSALQRARATLKARLPPRRLDWAATGEPSASERALLDRYMQAHEQGDMNSLARLLREDARVSAAPLPLWFDGRDAFLASARRSAAAGRFRFLATGANGQLAAASYVRDAGGSDYRPLAIDVLRIEGDRVAEITTFLRPDLFAAFGLPPSCDDSSGAGPSQRT
jgi:RNA polymerase sigma-70 factor (ECF subfamily)